MPLPKILTDIPRFFNWKRTDKADGSMGKEPWDLVNNRGPISYKAPSTWMPYEQAITISSDIGFAIMPPEEERRIVCIDLDHANTTEAVANEIIKICNSYTERSPSGKGYHIWGYAVLPINATNVGTSKGKHLNYKGQDIELFVSAHFVTVTGDWVNSTPLELNDITQVVQEITALKNSNITAKFVEPVKTFSDKEWSRKQFKIAAEKVSNASNGSRNDTLFGQARWLGEISAGEGGITATDIQAALVTATDLPHREALATIDSGINTGKMNPKFKPDPVKDKKSSDAFVYFTDKNERRYSPYKGATYLINSHHIITDQKQIWVYRNGIYEPDDEEAIGAELAYVAKDLYDKHAHAETMHFIRLRTQGNLNTAHTPHLFGMANGVLDIRTGKLLEHSPEHKLRQLSSVRFDPDAKNTVLVGMIKNATPDYEDLLNVLAAMLIDKQFKHWVFLVGPGGTGLSRIIKIINNLVGTAAICTTAPDVLKKNNFAAKDLLNARVLINTEVEGTKLETEFIKRLTGGDPLRAESKYGAAFPFYPACTPISTTNDPAEPYSAGQDLGRRIVVIQFPWFFVKEITKPGIQKLLDPETDTKIDNLDNMTALVNELLPRAQKILEVGEIPLEVGKGVAKLEELSHSVDSFLDTRCGIVENAVFQYGTNEITASDGEKLNLSCADIYEEYQKFCEGKTRCLSTKAFWKRMASAVRERGGNVRPSKNGQCRYVGLIEPNLGKKDDRFGVLITKESMEEHLRAVVRAQAQAEGDELVRLKTKEVEIRKALSYSSEDDCEDSSIPA